MKSPTNRQLEVLGFIKSYIRHYSYSPTIREVANHFGITAKAAYDHVHALKKKGLITTRKYQSRSIGFPALTMNIMEEHIKIPLISQWDAETPFFAEGNWNATISLPKTITGKGQFFALRVKDDSMRNAFILDGDIVIVRKQNVAENGQIVVAMINGYVTLQYFFKEKNRVYLQTENTRYEPNYADTLKILGCLVAMLRKY